MKRPATLSILMLIIGLLAGFLVACLTPASDAFSSIIGKGSDADTVSADIEIQNSQLLALAYETLDALEDGDYAALSALAHPDYGVIFVPYSTIDLSSDRCFTPNQIAAFADDSATYVWGLSRDGDGEPIELTPAEYFSQYVYNADYKNAASIGVNAVVKSGNSLENVQTVFPDCKFVDFYISGLDPELEGFDWCSLKVVFEKYEGEYKVVALIHSQWTI